MSDPLSDINRSMPFSDEAEKGILSCCLADPVRYISDCAIAIGEKGFYHPAHRLVFRALNAILKKGIHPDLVTISRFLLDNSLMDRIGGPAVLPELLSFVPTPAHYPHYLKILKDKLILRQVVEAGTLMVQRAYEYTEEPLELAARCVADIQKVHETALTGSTMPDGVTVADVFRAMVEETGGNLAKPSGYPTCFPWFDRMTGGLVPGNAYLFAAKMSTGKSSIVRQIGWSIARNERIPVSNFQFEMTARQEFQAICCLEGVDSNSWTTGKFSPDELAIIRRVGKLTQEDAPYKIHDDCRTFEEVEARIRADRLKRKIKVAIIDGPQRVQGFRKEGRERELSLVIDGFKQLARSLSISILMPVHINDDLMTRGSEDLENLCDVKVLMASRPSDDPNCGEVLVKLNKNRFGQRNVCCLYDFYGSRYTFVEKGPTVADIVPKKKGR